MVQPSLFAKDMMQDIYTTEFIRGIIDGSYNEDDVRLYCKGKQSLMPLFKSLHKAASTLIASKGIDGNYIWNLTERRFEFNNSKDLRLYLDEEFVNMQNAMGIVCDLIEKQPLQEKAEGFQLTEYQKAMFEKAINAGYMEAIESGYNWLYGGNRGKVRLAYFVNKAFNPNGTTQIPYKTLEAMFGVSRLDSAVQQAIKSITSGYNNQSKKVQEWKLAIDKLFKE